MESLVRLSSGLALEVSEGGDPKGLPIFALHGTPGSRLLYPKHVEDAKKKGIRLIGYSRPGYGLSTRTSGRRIVDTASDVAAIGDSLGLDRFGVWGHSGGGDPALACASVLPDRVVGAACLAGCAPYSAEGIDWFSGMGELNVEDFKLMLSDQGEWEKKNSQEAEILKHAPRAEFEEFLRSLLSDIDRSVLSDELIDFFQAQSREGFKAGINGMLDDNLAQSRQWGFDPTSIRVPVQIWHGRHDRFVPFDHGQWLVDHIPQREAHLEERDGHLTLFINRIPEVHDWLTSKF